LTNQISASNTTWTLWFQYVTYCGW